MNRPVCSIKCTHWCAFPHCGIEGMWDSPLHYGIGAEVPEEQPGSRRRCSNSPTTLERAMVGGQGGPGLGPGWGAQKNAEDGEESSRTEPNLIDS